jgi:hypothetical protein
VRHVWKESHKSCPLDSVCKCSLILGGKTSLTTVKNTSMWINELYEDFCILVVNKLDVVLIEVILFFHKFKQLLVRKLF